jgi:hypothetical protein
MAWLKGRKADYNLDDYDWDSLEGKLDEDDLALWMGLDDVTKRAILNDHYTDRGGLKKETIDEEKLLDTLSQLTEMQNAAKERPNAPNYEDYFAKAQADVDSSLNELESLRQSQVNNFNDELSNLSNSYNESRNALLSTQHQQNAQLMDTMTSQLDKQNRNALEAGASAGMRLAGNINTLLTTQNKQAQTSLETANQLAQMMVNQRNAEASVRGRYGDYMSQHFATKQDLKNSVYSNAQQRYNAAYQAYDDNLSDWSTKYQTNPAWKYSGAIGSATSATRPETPSAPTGPSIPNPQTNGIYGKTTNDYSKDLGYQYYKRYGTTP